MAIGDKIVLPDKRTLDLAKNKVDNIYAVVPISVAVPEPSPLDKNYIADKSTLDSMKAKLDNLPIFTPDGTASSSEVLSGKTFLSNSISKQTGTMPNRGAISGTLTTQGANCQIPNGYHNGSGKVTASFANLIASNIKQGVNIGGVVGTAPTVKSKIIVASSKRYSAGNEYFRVFASACSDLGITSFSLDNMLFSLLSYKRNGVLITGGYMRERGCYNSYFEFGLDAGSGDVYDNLSEVKVRIYAL